MNPSFPPGHLHRETILRRGRPARAEIRLLDNSVVAKSYAHAPFWFRGTVARVLVWREAAIGRQLGSFPGVTEFLDRPSSCTIRFRYVPARNIRTLPAGVLDEKFFDRLQVLLEELRNRGILHLDVGRNVLRAADGSPFLCDFASALNLGRMPSLVRQSLIRLREPYDLREISRLKKRCSPHLLQGQDRARIAGLLPWESLLRPVVRLQKRLRRLLETALEGSR